jgi:uncharacterized protein YecE (DUF72 family)
VYPASATQAQLARSGLSDYASHPLLRTVGIDRSYYAPIPTDDLQRYASQLPPGFPCCAKAPSTVTSATVSVPGRPASLEANPDFLSAERLSRELLEPFAAAFRDHAGPFLIECPPSRGRVGADEFVERLDRMLSDLPREFRYAIELREQAWLTPAYTQVLQRHGAAHVFNYWSAMPMPLAQAGVVQLETLPFLVVRLLLRPGMWYEDQRERFQPFDRLVEPDEQMRREVVELIARAVARAMPAYILVNNKAEGSAPLTIRELARRVAGSLPVAGTAQAQQR